MTMDTNINLATKAIGGDVPQYVGPASIKSNEKINSNKYNTIKITYTANATAYNNMSPTNATFSVSFGNHSKSHTITNYAESSFKMTFSIDNDILDYINMSLSLPYISRNSLWVFANVHIQSIEIYANDV